MPYLLDSDFAIDYLLDVPAAIRLSRELALEGMSISTVTYMEAFEGTLTAENAISARGKLDDFLTEAKLLDFDRDVATACAEIRVRLRSQGKRVNQRAHDLQIAATAVVYGLTVVTRNVADYLDVGVQVRKYP